MMVMLHTAWSKNSVNQDEQHKFSIIKINYDFDNTIMWVEAQKQLGHHISEDCNLPQVYKHKIYK